MRTIIRGFVAGMFGTIGMAGVSFTMRRIIEPTSPIRPTHYEKVVVKARETLLPDAEPLDRDTQIRIGEASHIGFGGLWGIVFALGMRNKEIRPLTHGIALGTGVWALAFGGYMPMLDISKGIKDMDAYEASRTFLCHVTHASVTMLLIDQMRDARRLSIGVG
ncbi:MAG: hypothetical protein ACR2P0_06100 [Acidimicrobiales bacterium]